MEQRDLLRDQIEQAGKVLAKVLSEFLGYKSIGHISQGIEVTAQHLKSELDIYIERLASLSKDEAKQYLKDRKLSAEHVEALSGYLKELGVAELEGDIGSAGARLKLAVELLNIADEISETFSFTRDGEKRQIEALVQQIT